MQLHHIVPAIYANLLFCWITLHQLILDRRLEKNENSNWHDEVPLCTIIFWLLNDNESGDYQLLMSKYYIVIIFVPM